LNAEHRAILTMVDMQGLTYEDVAEVVDCPLGTVRSRVSRARAAFKKALLARQGQEVMER
jgi:RNA polymerase sigma-70 factor (ECF subfamily)